MLMEIKQLKYFQQVARDLSFSKAAKSLYISQQALSKIIKNLETELGAPLFERAHSGVALTDFGRRVLVESWEITAHIDRLHEMSGQWGKTQATIRLGFPKVTYRCPDGSDFIPESIRRFKAEHPGVILDVTELPSDACIDLLDAELLDMVMAVGPIDFSRYVCRKVVDENILPLVSCEHGLSAYERVSFDDIKDEKFFIPSGSTVVMRNICEAFYAAGLASPPHSHFVFLNCAPAMLIEHVVKGEGIAIIPENHISCVDFSRVKMLNLYSQSIKISRCLVNRRDIPLTLEAAAFRDHFLALSAEITLG